MTQAMARVWWWLCGCCWLMAGPGRAFRTGVETGLICYQCVGTHPGCGLYDFDSRWYWGHLCPRKNDKCVKLIERRGADVLITRDCLSNLEAHRVDIPADKYGGCKTAVRDSKLAQYTFNSVPELDTKRNYYDNVTYCLCALDHWCNTASNHHQSHLFLLILLPVLLLSTIFSM